MRPPLNAPPGFIPLSDSALNVRAQNIAPLQDVESILGSGSTHYMPQLQLSTNTIYPASYRRSFFSAKRLFFRAARDVSGVRSSPPWARVEIKLKMSFRLLSHSPSHERALALTSPPPDFLFSFIHPKPPSLPPQKGTSLLVLPTANAILNFATKFFDMLTK